MRNLKPEDQATLAALRARILATVAFVESVQDFRYGKGIREAVAKALEGQSLRSMRLIAREVDGMTIALEPHQRDGLEALLAGRLGVDKEAERAVIQAQVAAILKRGTIATAKERRRLADYADLLEATGGDPSEAAAVRQLLHKS